MLKIIQQSILSYLEREIPEVQARFRKRRGTRDHIVSIRWTLEPTKNTREVHFCFTDYSKAFHSVDQENMRNVLRDMDVPQHLIVLIRNLYSGQEATITTEYRETEWLPIGKRVPQGCTLSLYLFNLYAEHIVREAGLNGDERRTKIGGRKINKLRYANDTTLLAGKLEDLKRLVRKLKKESARADLQLIFKTKKSNDYWNAERLYSR